MGAGEQTRQGERFFRPIVAFDFDGTLTIKDSFTAFLAWRAGAGRYAAGLVGLAPAAFLYLFTRDRGRLKATAARKFLRGASRVEIETDARRFAEGHAREILRPDAIRAWKRWQSLGARLVIVTASPEQVVAPFARGLGADLLIGTRLEFGPDDRFTGKFAGKNCRGEEKVRRLKAAFGDDVKLEAAYGDTAGDRKMLAMADEQGFKMFRGTP